ncbi:hypothetical protein ACHAW6_003380 [Cyclotella cf. meneghiniana]
MPLAPLGCVVQFHIKPCHCRTWGEHSTRGWYIGTSPKHNCTHCIFVKATCTHSLSETTYFKHKYITQPTITYADMITKTFHDLTTSLKGMNNLKIEQNMDAVETTRHFLTAACDSVHPYTTPSVLSKGDIPRHGTTLHI